MYERYVAVQKSTFVVKLDKAYFHVNNFIGNRRICYVKNGENVPTSCACEGKESFVDKLMVVGVKAGKGTFPLIRYGSQAEVILVYYIGQVLESLLEVHVPSMYRYDTNKVIGHHDQGTSHASKKPAAYAADLKSKLGITIIPNS